MQKSDAEIAFARYGHQLQSLLAHEVYDWTGKLLQHDGRFLAAGQHFDQMESAPARGQVKINYIRYLSPRTREVQTIEILMGHSPDWTPVISVSGTKSAPVQIDSKGSANEDMAAIKNQVMHCFKNVGLNLR